MIQKLIKKKEMICLENRSILLYKNTKIFHKLRRLKEFNIVFHKSFAIQQ